VEKLGRDIDERFSGDVDGKASGILVNTSGWIEELGYQLLLHAAEVLRINVILIMGHDRLYSMITTHFRKKAAQEDEMADDEAGPVASFVPPKIIKLPRSGGVVSRDSTFRRLARMQCIKRYFNGDLIRSTEGTVVQQYTPYLSEAPFQNIKLYKLSSVSLASSMLPVSGKQTTDPVQLTPITDLNPTLQHAVLAVCHPSAVEAFQKSGEPSDLYLSGMAGFVVVEKVHMEKSSLSLLSPCSGALPSFTFLIGDIVWIE
jgi:polyribonucleotide 5'-hydroxyl-kinase